MNNIVVGAGYARQRRAKWAPKSERVGTTGAQPARQADGTFRPMVVNVDHYATLQVDPRAKREVIQAAYRTLARTYHPDIAGGSEARMAALNSAWAVLRDPAARAAYDRARLALPPAPTPARTDGTGARPTPARTGQERSDILDFGRYAGWSLGELARHDPDYLKWLARTPGGRRYQREIESLLATPAGVASAAPATRRTGRFRRP